MGVLQTMAAIVIDRLVGKYLHTVAECGDIIVDHAN